MTRTPRKSPSLAAIGGGLAAALTLGLIANVAPTDASWRDNEWVNADLSTIDCATPVAHEARGAGRLLSGNLLSTDLDDIVALKGVTVMHDGTTSTADPTSSTEVAADTYTNPLDVTALGAINVSLNNVLVIPSDTDLGIVNQYARARADGTSAGAAGVVNDSGAIDLSQEPTGSEAPTFATIELGQVLDSVLGTGLSGGIANLTDARIDVGAVASSAVLDACGTRWERDVYANLDRDYYIAGLRTELDSALIGNLATTAGNALDTLETTVEGLGDDTDLLTALSTSVTDAVGAIAGDIALGTPVMTLTVGVDLDDARALLNGPISDDGIVTLDLDQGTAIIDTAALFDSVDGLNNQAPNTQLLLNSTVINALTSAIASALSAWVAEVLAAANAALDAATVTLTATIPISVAGPVELGSISVGADASLGALLDGTAPLTSVFTPIDASVCTAQAVACALVDTLVAAIIDPLPTTLDPQIADAVSTAITGTTSSVLTVLETDVQVISADIVTLLDDSLSFLFGESGALSLVVNAQNSPDPNEGGGDNQPGWADSLPGPTAAPFSTGQYDVSAIRMVVAGVSDGLALDFARSSAGPNGPA